jgi:hypothetical protein
MSTEINEPERQREVDITEIAEGLRDLDIDMDTALRKDQDWGNAVSGTMHRCVNKFWKKKGRGVTQYELITMTTEQKIQMIEAIYEDMRTDSKWQKDKLGSFIAADIDAIFELVKDFLSRNESEKHKAERLQKEAALEARRLADEEAKAKRLAKDEERQELNRQRKQEEEQDLVTNATWSDARKELIQELGTVGKTYKRLVSRFGDTNLITPYGSKNYLHVGQILGGLIQLTDYMATRPFKRSEDTYHCCELLRDCTCFLACDDKYKRPNYLSKDDRFAGMYKANPKFRRVWVAFLRQLVQYVEMLYADEAAAKKLYLDPQKLADMHWSDIFWLGYGGYPAYSWAKINQDITTAEEAIKQEPEPKPTHWERLHDLDGPQR